MKAFVSRQDDGHVRRPYARHTEPQPRRFVMCGTTNVLTDLPNDPAGNRRFVPVVLGAAAISIEDYMGAMSEHRIGRALKNAGWSMERVRSDGKIKRLWQLKG